MLPFASFNKTLLLALFGTIFITIAGDISTVIAKCSSNNLFKKVRSYETIIDNSNGNDVADIYFPIHQNNINIKSFPIALFLQGALVDKSDYSKFAKIVASYGFVVVVPNNFNKVFIPPGFPQGFYSEQEQVKGRCIIAG